MSAVQIELLVAGCGHPEGPDVLPDGRVVFVNSYTHEVAAWHPQQGRTRYGYTGGAPNACVLGADGCVYVTQTPTVAEWTAPDARPPSIQRIAPDGTVELVCTHVDGAALHGPNDLAFGADGRLWFTDSGHWDPDTRPHPGRIVAIDASGQAELIAELDHVYPNGIAADPDGSIVWGESYTRRLWRLRPDGDRQLLCELPEGHIPDGFKRDVEDRYWVTATFAHGIHVVSEHGELVDFVPAGTLPLNCAFDGRTLYVTDQGPLDPSNPAPMNGQLIRLDAGVEGAPRFRGAAEHGFAPPAGARSASVRNGREDT
jgi:gluconolactonase